MRRYRWGHSCQHPPHPALKENHAGTVAKHAPARGHELVVAHVREVRHLLLWHPAVIARGGAHCRHDGISIRRGIPEFAGGGRFEEIIAALALMANMTAEAVERSVNDTRAESLIVLARAIGLAWETTRSIIALAGQRYRRSPADIGKCIAAFQRLNPTTAQRILEFQRSRGPGAGRRH